MIETPKWAAQSTNDSGAKKVEKSGHSGSDWERLPHSTVTSAGLWIQLTYVEGKSTPQVGGEEFHGTKHYLLTQKRRIHFEESRDEARERPDDRNPEFCAHRLGPGMPLGNGKTTSRFFEKSGKTWLNSMFLFCSSYSIHYYILIIALYITNE